MKAWSDNFNALSLDIDRAAHAEYWLKGGRGSGKSVFVARKILLGMLQHPLASAIVYRRVAATLRQSVYEEFVKAIGALGLRPWCSFRLSPLEIRFKPTGQRILFRGADDPAKSKSITLAKGYFGYLWFEEAAEFLGIDDIRTIKASTVRGQAEQRPVTILSYNPPMSARNWINREVLAPVPDRLVHHSTYLDLPPEWIGRDFISQAETLRDTNERAYRHMYMGEATGTGGQVFENVVLREVIDEEIRGFERTYAGLDWGWFPDPLHFVRCAYHDGRLTIYDEYRTNKASNRDVFNYLVAKKGLTRDEEVIADSSELKSVSDMRSFGMRCVAATKGPGSVRASMKWLQGLREIVIDPVRCPWAAREFSEYEYERDRAGEPVDVFPDANNHAIDGVRYATNRIWLRPGG
ncbi:MAG: phage terminase large subunit [Clostridia bacterium]|nr:phage terminase large subunit [Clostridia bacterium]